MSQIIAALLVIVAAPASAASMESGIYDIESLMTADGGPKENNEADVSILITYSTIFFDGKEVNTKQFLFSKIPDVRSLNIPFRSGYFGVVTLICENFDNTGHLSSCEVKVEPENVGYEDIGRALAQNLAVDSNYVRSLRRPIKDIFVRVRLANSDVPATSGPCLPPVCVAMPLPPPPPPARLLDDAQLEDWYDGWEAKWRAAAEASTTKLREARLAVSEAGGFAPDSEKWNAARNAAFRYVESRNRLSELVTELTKFRISKFQTASAADLEQLAKVEVGKQTTLDQTEKNSTDLLLSLLK